MLSKHRILLISVPLFILPVAAGACNHTLTPEEAGILSDRSAPPSIISKDLPGADSIANSSEPEQVEAHEHTCDKNSAEEWIKHIDKTLNSLDIKHS
ncbi:hypothetical protein [Neptuniibacter caesariensis]|uniref:tRNA modification GTPase n=1 Tax=Neptuniibacter caesariensis TaxID=207954 RepID=A0A7U8C6N7_NEPCE|nr:hypothetical protein [Neptuniibacter caesariensis]EAR62565.1 tRNA modification GTPase [Oceanospirillum sp. MED92] [Neptuniibacter caesariensis]